MFETDKMAFSAVCETGLEIERLKKDLQTRSESFAEIERELRLRLVLANREISHLRNSLHDSESTVQHMRSKMGVIDNDGSLRIDDRSYSTSFNSGSYRNTSTTSEQYSTHNGSETSNQEEEEQILFAKDSETAGENGDDEDRKSLLLQNPAGLNASNFIPVAKKRKLGVRISVEGNVPETKEECWERMFSLLLRFDAEHSHCNVPQRYKSTQSDGTNICLGRWLQFQRVLQRRNRMQADRLMRMQALVDQGKLLWDFTL